MIEYFFFGMIFASVGVTLLNSVCEIISGLTELIKAHISVSIIKCNDAIEQISKGPETSTHVIGFDITGSEEEDLDD